MNIEERGKTDKEGDGIGGGGGGGGSGGDDGDDDDNR